MCKKSHRVCTLKEKLFSFEEYNVHLIDHSELHVIWKLVKLLDRDLLHQLRLGDHEDGRDAVASRPNVSELLKTFDVVVKK